MSYEKVPAPSIVYHLTKKENLNSILEDEAIRRFEDSECWFCESLPKMKAYMEQTVLCEGKPYYAVEVSSAVTRDLCRRIMFSLNSRLASRMITGTAGIRKFRSVVLKN